jgi:hypothetical protein
MLELEPIDTSSQIIRDEITERFLRRTSFVVSTEFNKFRAESAEFSAFLARQSEKLNRLAAEDDQDGMCGVRNK